MVSPPKFFYLSLVSQWNLVYLLLIDMALWRFSFLPHFRNKNLTPPMDLAFFVVSRPNFIHHHWYPNETWHTCFSLTWLYDVFIFYSNLKKKSRPLIDLAFFVVSRPKVFHHHCYPNVTWCITTHYRHGFMKFWFSTQFSKEKPALPPMNLKIFRGFHMKKQ